LRGSRAQRSQRNSDQLLHVGIDAPATILLGKLTHGGEYLFSAAARGDSITNWLRKNPAGGKDVQRNTRRRLLLELGRFIGRVHAAGFIHGDLRPGNVLAEQRADSFRFTLIDNERTRRRVPPPGRALLRNLMQLNMLPPDMLSRADRMRFFSAWRSQMRTLSPIEAKVLGSEAYHWAMRRLYEKGAL
jgi:serine/threonine protein kinase